MGPEILRMMKRFNNFEMKDVNKILNFEKNHISKKAEMCFVSDREIHMNQLPRLQKIFEDNDIKIIYTFNENELVLPNEPFLLIKGASSILLKISRFVRKLLSFGTISFHISKALSKNLNGIIDNLNYPLNNYKAIAYNASLGGAIGSTIKSHYKYVKKYVNEKWKYYPFKPIGLLSLYKNNSHRYILDNEKIESENILPIEFSDIDKYSKLENDLKKYDYTLDIFIDKGVDLTALNVFLSNINDFTVSRVVLDTSLLRKLQEFPGGLQTKYLILKGKFPLANIDSQICKVGRTYVSDEYLTVKVKEIKEERCLNQ